VGRERALFTEIVQCARGVREEETAAQEFAGRREHHVRSSANRRFVSQGRMRISIDEITTCIGDPHLVMALH